MAVRCYPEYRKAKLIELRRWSAHASARYELERILVPSTREASDQQVNQTVQSEWSLPVSYQMEG